MGRPPQFDRTEAVQHAMEAFWELGYEHASTAVLEKRMGIGRSSLYAAFGSKDGLYAAALEQYIEDLRARVIEPLRAPGPALDVLRTFFDSIARRGEAGCGRLRCCMIVHAAVAGADRSPETRAQVRRVLEELDDAFDELLVRAADEGALPARASWRGPARFLTTTFQALNVAANAGRTRRELEDIIRTALDALH